MKNNQSFASKLVLWNEWAIQDIETAKGHLVNLDYFSVNIEILPTGFTIDSLFKHVRLNINDFVDKNFEPFDEMEEKIWKSKNPLGAVIHIDLDAINIEDGSVITSRFQDNNWIFTTVQAPGDFQHPVSGNRQFGYVENSSQKVKSYTFYTRGADRLTGEVEKLVQWIGTKTGAPTPFKLADDLWIGFQKRLNEFINKRGGKATINAPKIKRPDWETLKEAWFVKDVKKIKCPE